MSELKIPTVAYVPCLQRASPLWPWAPLQLYQLYPGPRVQLPTPLHLLKELEYCHLQR